MSPPGRDVRMDGKFSIHAVPTRCAGLYLRVFRPLLSTGKPSVYAGFCNYLPDFSGFLGFWGFQGYFGVVFAALSALLRSGCQPCQNAQLPTR